MFMSEKEPCYLCGVSCRTAELGGARIYEYYCDTCGEYGVDSYTRRIRDADTTERKKVACVAAERRLQGLGPYWIVSEQPDEALGRPTVTIDSLLESYPRSAAELLDRSLLNLSLMVQHPGDVIKLDPDHPTVLFSENSEEAYYVLDQFVKLRYIDLPGRYVDREKPLEKIRHTGFSIQAEGWKRIGELKARPAGDQPQAFVAMWFDASTKDVFEKGIKPAIEADDTTTALRIDLKQHNNKICDEIIAEIRRSRFVVADFTGQRGGVYFEAGFARGLGIPVIHLAKKGELDKLHFDTRQYNHIEYEDCEDLRTQLTNRIRATIL